MILSVGEFVLDVFKDKNEKRLMPGGAPFNVFLNVNRFETPCLFYGAIGKDIDTSTLIQSIKERIPFSRVIFESAKNTITSKAVVSIINGERHFKFDRKNNPDDKLRVETLKSLDLNHLNIVHFGSLMLSTENGFSFLKNAIKELRKYKNIKISFDVNFRKDIFDHIDVGLFRTKEIIKLCDYIKISDDELDLLCEDGDVNYKLNSLFTSNQAVFLSKGNKGSVLSYKNKIIESKTIKVNSIDTTGAGDAFYAYILSCLDQDIDLLNHEKKIKETLRIANIVGALTTLKIGASFSAPTKEELKSYLEGLSR